MNMLPAWESGSDWVPPADNGNMVPRMDYLRDYVATGAATTFAGERFAFNAVKMPETGRPFYIRNPFRNSSDTSRAAQYYSTMRAALLPWISKSYVYEIDEPRESDRAFVER
jgi:hypothetical protein